MPQLLTGTRRGRRSGSRLPRPGLLQAGAKEAHGETKPSPRTGVCPAPAAQRAAPCAGPRRSTAPAPCLGLCSSGRRGNSRRGLCACLWLLQRAPKPPHAKHQHKPELPGLPRREAVTERLRGSSDAGSTRSHGACCKQRGEPPLPRASPAAPQGASRSTSPGARRAGAGCPQSPAPSPPGPD